MTSKGNRPLDSFYYKVNHLGWEHQSSAPVAQATGVPYSLAAVLLSKAHGRGHYKLEGAGAPSSWWGCDLGLHFNIISRSDDLLSRSGDIISHSDE